MQCDNCSEGVDDKENTLVKEFITQGCSISFEFGPNKTYYSMHFLAVHYQSVRTNFAEMNHDELNPNVRELIKAHCYDSTTLLGQQMLVGKL